MFTPLKVLTESVYTLPAYHRVFGEYKPYDRRHCSTAVHTVTRNNAAQDANFHGLPFVFDARPRVLARTKNPNQPHVRSWEWRRKIENNSARRDIDSIRPCYPILPKKKKKRNCKMHRCVRALMNRDPITHAAADRFATTTEISMSPIQMPSNVIMRTAVLTRVYRVNDYSESQSCPAVCV